MYRTQKPYLHKDGRLVWGDLAVTIPRGSGGEALCGLATIENITARKKAEEELSRLEKIESLKVLAGGIATISITSCAVFSGISILLARRSNPAAKPPCILTRRSPRSNGRKTSPCRC